MGLRVVAQMVTLVPKLKVVDFVSSYRSENLDKHHRWILRKARLCLYRAVGKEREMEQEQAEDGSAASGSPPSSTQPFPSASAPRPTHGRPPSGAKVSGWVSKAGSAIPAIAYDPMHPDMDDTGQGGSDSSGSASESSSASSASSSSSSASRDTSMPRHIVTAITIPAQKVTVPSELRYEIARYRCHCISPFPAHHASQALTVSLHAKVRIYMSFDDRPGLELLAGMEDWAVMLSGTAGEAQQLAEQFERLANAGAQRRRGVVTNVAQGGKLSASGSGSGSASASCLSRFIFGYVRAMFMGVRIHVFGNCPRALLGEFDFAGYMEDVAQMTRGALGKMVGMVRPAAGLGVKQTLQREPDSAPIPPLPHQKDNAWSHLFWDSPNVSADRFMIDVYQALAATLHSDMFMAAHM